MSYTVNGTTYSYDSSINQRIKDKLVNDNVHACVTDMMTELIKANPDEWCDFENTSWEVCPHCDSRDFVEADEEDFGKIKEYLGDPELEIDEVDFEDFYVCENCGEVFSKNEVGTDYAEPLEYYIVDPWFGEKLRDQGEMVMERWGGWIWGRQTFGQAILLDYVTSKIAEGLGLLEGQENSWENDV